MSSALTTFIGVDLAWQSDKNHSGIVVSRGSEEGLTIVACSKGITTLDAVLDCILVNTTENTVIAIDAPLVIANVDGQRPCETLIGKRFGARHGSAHTSNLTLYPNAGSVRFENMLRANGFSHNPCPSTDKRKSGKWFFEVYPHPAQLVLFDLDQIIKYKKGTVAQKRAGLKKFREYIKDRLVCGSPPIHNNEILTTMLTLELAQLSGKFLKQYEDQLDACLCSYLAFYYWYWGSEKNELIGAIESGYIVNPSEPFKLAGLGN